ncbi:glycosyltransferase family 4 protein [Rhizobiaceae bacterium CRRU44]|uniref:Glycosyltransferase family 4 protein n=1 Tax=Ferranicluibacter rubi TaxID=2715133 RepID=A0AA43ZD72_9HYPH|nr:glycosyltransferase [Ferranicluibacter rubi]NHT74910.1 glycosyltransferase family 4 protein [Ferranicluibacter rubi]
MKILCVHPNIELYGSDRSFLQVLEAVRAADPDGSVDVRLVGEGPITPHVERASTRILYGPMWVLRKADLKRIVLTAPISFPLAVLRARKVIRESGCDLLYISTLVPFDYLVAARFFKGPTICHVREIPTGKAMAIFSRVLAFSRSRVIFNSKATSDAFTVAAGTGRSVIYNGVAPPSVQSETSASGPLKVLLIGRFNAWKGQQVLVKAIASLPSEIRDRIEVRLVGGVYGGQDHFVDDVRALIVSSGLERTVTIHPFADDPSEHFLWSDVVAVPSTLPEPFGRVAIEGMSYRRPVIAAGHGGLPEIVENGETGFLVAPGSETSLAEALTTFVLDRKLCKAMGDRSFARYEALFSEDAYGRKMVAAFGLDRPASGAPR